MNSSAHAAIVSRKRAQRLWHSLATIEGRYLHARLVEVPPPHAENETSPL